MLLGQRRAYNIMLNDGIDGISSIIMVKDRGRGIGETVGKRSMGSRRR